ncbi:hypothetical protein SAY87_010025 [Trapa incisa]|uniref:Uncharacterized protein n=1 Tax=Trapa incisa TaxID=236973 RepID=A0AAN7GGJ5_9MYRT|nr:hypothetical protein SAY87_010025 [Trapa incisa]
MGEVIFLYGSGRASGGEIGGDGEGFFADTPGVDQSPRRFHAPVVLPDCQWPVNFLDRTPGKVRENKGRSTGFGSPDQRLGIPRLGGSVSHGGGFSSAEGLHRCRINVDAITPTTAGCCPSRCNC